MEFRYNESNRNWHGDFDAWGAFWSVREPESLDVRWRRGFVTITPYNIWINGDGGDAIRMTLGDPTIHVNILT